MKLTAWIFAICFLSSIAACKGPETQPEKSESAPRPTQKATPAEAVSFSGLPNQAWSDHLVKEIRATELPDLALKDATRFCPKYSKLSRESRIVTWATLATAIAKRESNFMTGTVYEESNGVDSIGLYQLSYGDAFCPKKKSEGDLTDPFVNITCAVKLMEKFTKADGVIAAGGYVKYGASSPKGLARYWSVIRVPDSKSKHHLAEIKAAVQKSAGCQ